MFVLWYALELGDRQARWVSWQAGISKTIFPRVATYPRIIHDYSMAHRFMPPLEVLAVERVKNQAG